MYAPSILYNDFIELMRLSGIYREENEVLSLFSLNELKNMYERHSSTPWMHGQLVMNFENYVETVKQLASKAFPDV
jgi:hypothetical protein